MPWIIGITIVVAIIALSAMIDSKKKKTKRMLVESWIDEAFKDSVFIPEERITVREIKEELETVGSQNDLAIIIEAITTYVKCMDKLGCKEVAYITDNQGNMHLDQDLMDRIDDFVRKYKEKMKKTYKIIEDENNSEEFLLDTFKKIIETSYRYNKEFIGLFIECYEPKVVAADEDENEDEIESKEPEILEMLASRKKKQKNGFDKRLEDEMKARDLEDWQKDLVKKGEYDPWNFEEKDLEEEDYYSEDDDLDE